MDGDRSKNSSNLKFTNDSCFDCRQGAVRKVVLNADGQYCVTCGSDKSLKLWNARKQMLLSSYHGHGMEVMDADCSCDSSQLVSGGQDKTIIIWDVSTGQPVRRVRAHMATVNCVRFNEDDSVFVSGSLDGTVKIWDGKSRTVRDPIQVLDEARDSVTAVALSQHEIATVSLDQHVRRYDIRKGIMESDCLHAPLCDVRFSNDGQCLLISGLNQCGLVLLDKASGAVLARFTGHRNKKYRINNGLLNNDSLVVSGSEDGFLYIWSLLDGQIQGKLPHSNSVATVACHPSQPELVAGAENKLYLWSIITTESSTEKS